MFGRRLDGRIPGLMILLPLTCTGWDSAFALSNGQSRRIVIMRYVIPHLVEGKGDPVLNRATITRHGQLTAKYLYLQDYIE